MVRYYFSFYVLLVFFATGLFQVGFASSLVASRFCGRNWDEAGRIGVLQVFSTCGIIICVRSFRTGKTGVRWTEPTFNIVRKMSMVGEIFSTKKPQAMNKIIISINNSRQFIQSDGDHNCSRKWNCLCCSYCSRYWGK